MSLPFYLLTDTASTDEESQDLETALADLKKGSRGPATLWDKHSPLTSTVANDLAKTKLVESYTMLRANSFGTFCEDQDLPEGWKALVFMPDNVATNTRRQKLREIVTWYGVDDAGRLMGGTYIPSHPVMQANEAFQDLATHLQDPDSPQVTLAPGNDISLDGWDRQKTWKNAVPAETKRWLQVGSARYFDIAKNMSDEDMHSDETAANYTGFERTSTRVIGAMTAMFTSKKMGTLWACQKNLESAMDPVALKLSRLAPTPTTQHYNWIMGQTKDAKQHTFDPEIGLKRQQALTLFPLLARDWLGEVSRPRYYSGPEYKGTILETIDSGEQLVPILAKSYGVTPRHIKSVRGLTWQMTGSQEGAREPANFLKTLPLDHMPQNKSQWNGFRKVLRYAQDLADLDAKLSQERDLEQEFDHHGQIGQGNVFKRSAPNERGWDKKISIMEDLGPRHEAVSKSLGFYAAGGVKDMADHVGEKLIEPILANARYETAKKEGKSEGDAILAAAQDTETTRNVRARTTIDLIQGMGTRQVAQAQDRWHRNITALNHTLQDPSIPRTDKSWTPVLSDQDIDGWHVKELTSDESLRRQGLLENHCVGGYTDHILNNSSEGKTSLVYSIEDQGKIKSTLEVSVTQTPEGPKAEIVQNQGKSNSTPDPKALKIGRAIAKKLTKVPAETYQDHYESVGQVKATQQDVTLTRQGTPQTVPVNFVKSGYDPTDEESRRKAHNAFASLLPKSLVKDFHAFEAHVLKSAQQKEETQKSVKKSIPLGEIEDYY